MAKILLPVLTIFLFSCKQNNKAAIGNSSEDSVKYINESISFFKQVLGKQLRDPNFLLADKPLTFTYPDCFSKEILADSSTFTPEEMDFIRQKKYPAISRWTKAIFPGFKFISSDSIAAIFKHNGGGWEYFHNKYGDSFNTFSMPIFLRGYAYCLFYTGQSCGGLCGEGRWVLYKRFYTEWKKLKSYCGWIS